MLDDKSTIDVDKTTQDIMGAMRKKDTVWIVMCNVQCIHIHPQVTIFRLDQSNDLDKSIVNILVRKRCSDRISQLRSAIIWNRPDLAREILFDNADDSSSLDNSVLTLPFNPNTQMFQTDIFDLFDESLRSFAGISFVTFFIDSGSCEYLVRYMPKDTDTSSLTLSTVGLLLKRLIGQFTHPLYMETESRAVRFSVIEQPYIELFIWAVVSNRYFTVVSLYRNSQNCARPVPTEARRRAVAIAIGRHEHRSAPGAQSRRPVNNVNLGLTTH
ncbi:unnamed protein product [Sphagnum balticum]